VRNLCGGDPSCPGACQGAVTTTKCVYPANQCRGQSCSSNVLVSAAFCDAGGACPAGSSMACPSTAPVCDAGGTQCVKVGVGATCGSDAGCTSGRCGGGRCCAAGLSCTGPCDTGACDSGGACVHQQPRTKCGTTIPGPNPGANDTFSVCDATGACLVPYAFCGTTNPSSCQLTATQACCSHSDNPDTTQTCGARATCIAAGQGSGIGMENCRVNADCPTGLKCCRDGEDNSWRVCQTDCTPAACDPRLIDCGIVDQACDPNGPAADPDCPASAPNCTIYGNICG
jgi:hypothetical protein